MRMETPIVRGLAAAIIVTCFSAAAAAQQAEPIAATSLAQAAAPGERPLGGIVSELCGGILAHDRGLFGSEKESGVDVNFEVLFTSPGPLRYILSPRPHVGASINTQGDTSKVYAGLTWDFNLGPVFIEGSFGGTLHDGETGRQADRSRKELGCPFNFREAFSIGVRVWRHHSVSLMVDHISNASLCDENEGMETLGLRYGYKY